ncbi:MAG: hypothetical protein MdMp024_1941 [Bacteroidales bacterium]
MENELISTFFTMQGLGNTIQSLIAAGLVYILFQKSLSKQIGELRKEFAQQIGELRKEVAQQIDGLKQQFDELEKQFDGLKKQFDGLKQQFDELEKQFIRLDAKMDALRAELKADIKDLHRDNEDLRKEIQNIKENDLFHISKAILLHARETVNNKESFERIKDNLLEAVPENKKSQLEAINFNGV